MKKHLTFLNVIIAGLLFVFLSGLVQFGYSPRTLLANASMAAGALKKKYSFYLDYLRGKEKSDIFRYLWYKVDHEMSGVTLYDHNKVYKGLTLYSNHDTKAFLIDMEGRVVHQWSKPFREVWPNPKHILDTVPEQYIFWRHVQLLPNGDLIAVYVGTCQSPYGGGIIKIDKNSNLLWKVPINAHHDFDIDDQGNIHVLEHTYEYMPELKRALISDGIAVISPQGELLQQKKFLKSIWNSKFAQYIPWFDFDPFHTNNIEILKKELADRFPMFKEGDILISMRTPSAVFVIDAETYEPKWCMRGVTVNQHDPDFMENGTIRVFDNNGASNCV